MIDVCKEGIEKHPLFPEIKAYEKFEKEGKLEQYTGKWIAIYKGEIVAVSSNSKDLSLTAYRKCGYKYILMRKVETEKVDYSFLRRTIY